MIRGSSATTSPTCASRLHRDRRRGQCRLALLVQLFQGGRQRQPTGPVLATTTPAQRWHLLDPVAISLLSGTTSLVAKAVDVVGNPGPGKQLGRHRDHRHRLVRLQRQSDRLQRNHNLPRANPAGAGPVRGGPVQPGRQRQGALVRPAHRAQNVPTWFASGTALGAATDIPMQGDFDGDGKVDLATYNPTTATWTLPARPAASPASHSGLPRPASRSSATSTAPASPRSASSTSSTGVGQWTIASPSGGLRVCSVRPAWRHPRSLATTTVPARTSWPSTGPARDSSWSTKATAIPRR